MRFLAEILGAPGSSVDFVDIQSWVTDACPTDNDYTGQLATWTKKKKKKATRPQ